MSLTLLSKHCPQGIPTAATLVELLVDLEVLNEAVKVNRLTHRYGCYTTIQRCEVVVYVAFSKTLSLSRCTRY